MFLSIIPSVSVQQGYSPVEGDLLPRLILRRIIVFINLASTNVPRYLFV